MIRIRKRALALTTAVIAAGGLAFGVSGGTAHAAVSVTATTHLTQRPDSGYSGNDWALDNLTRTATVGGGGAVAASLCGTPQPASCFAYTISISDTGTAFATTGAISPGAQEVAIKGSPQATVAGTMNGTFDASSDSPSASLVPASLAGASVSSGDWAEQFFPAGTQFDVTHSTDSFSYTYTDAKDCQKWVDAATGTQATSGDITGADSCTTSLAAVGNQTVTVGQAASIQVFGSTTSSDKALTYTTTGLLGGLSLNGTTGLISGTPTATATGGTVTVTAADFGGVQASTSFGITVSPASTAPAPVIIGHGVATAVAPTREGVSWSQNAMSWVKLVIVGPGPINGHVSYVYVPTSAESVGGTYTGLDSGHGYTVTLTPEATKGGAAIGPSPHLYFVTER